MFLIIKLLDYFADSNQPDGLAAFIDRVSEDTSINLESSNVLQNSMLAQQNYPSSLSHSYKFLECGNIDNSNNLYSAKEYDAANMLIDYSNQKNFNLQRNLSLNRDIDDQKLRQRQNVPLQQIRSNINQNNLIDNTRTHVSLVNSHTSQPFYSQAFYSDCEMGQDSNSYLNTFSGNSNLQRKQNTLLSKTNNNTLQQQQTLPKISASSTSNETFQNVLRNSSLPLSSIGSSTCNSFFTAPNTMTTISNNSMLAAATLDHYVPHILAAAGVSSSAASVINSISSSVSGNVLNDRTQQLITQHHPHLWFNVSSNSQSTQQQLPLQQQYKDDRKTLQVNFLYMLIFF